MPSPLRLLLASSNSGKRREYLELAGGAPLELDLLPNFSEIPAFDESAPTFAENAAGKALHFGRFADEKVLADDSGLVVPALGGAPGVYSARYAGPGASDRDRINKLLGAAAELRGDARQAYFVCVVAIARRGRVLAVVSDRADGEIALEPRGAGGFGYDPIFYLPQRSCTFAELSREDKSSFSHRGKAFRKMLDLLASPDFSLDS
ncbi:MAG: RdgB/HAM1 family non-canonical purine NTP pyrophosphatase [Candidatus Acidiferrales bacterium]